VGFVAVDEGAGVTVCCGVCGDVCGGVCGGVFCVAWAMPVTGIASRIMVSVEQNRFI
jgi:hypothetical protein